MTKSILHFHPRPTDHGKTLTCRAENTELSHAAIEDHWKLVIHCKFLGAKIQILKKYLYKKQFSIKYSIFIEKVVLFLHTLALRIVFQNTKQLLHVKVLHKNVIDC